MPLEVIMPALGMAQDSGLVVAWRKSPGDSVNEGDALFEVETDKATMEVEAQGSGYLTDVRAKAGDEVPVGQTIALISETREGGDIGGITEEPRTEGVAESESASQAAVRQSPVSSTISRAVAKEAAGNGGRTLASPKARRIALERGIELRDLLGSGVSEPIHANDVLEFSGVRRAAVTNAYLAAIVSDAEFVETISGLQSSDPEMTAGKFAAILAVGAAGAAGIGARIAIRLERIGEGSQTLIDLDLPWRETAPQQTPQVPDLVLRDLTGTRWTALHQFAVTTPTLTLASGNGLLSIRLDYQRGTLDDSSAMALISGFAERLEAPLRQLL